MAYFSQFPLVKYEFTTHTDKTPITEIITDLSTRISMVISDADFDNMCTRYTIATGELPEHISFKFYKTPELAWAVLYINNIANLNSEWPLTDVALTEYVVSKYGLTHVNDVHHYEKLPEGVVMDQSFIISQYGSGAVNPVTNMDYETILNERKRFIYVIKPEYIGNFAKRYMELLV